MKAWLLIFVFLNSGLAWAQDGYESMKGFIQQEDDRLKEIKLLSLDLEKAGLELKKKEIQNKMEGLNGALPQEKGAASVVRNTGASSDLRLSGIMINDKVRQAFIVAQGKQLSVHEGQDLANGMKIAKITAKSVSIVYADGTTRQLELGS